MRITRIVRQTKALTNESIPVNIRIAYAGTQFELFSGEYATAKNWDAKRRLFKQGGMAVYMNRQLDNLENLIKEVWYETIQQHPTPDPKELKLAIDKRRFPDKYSTKYLPPLEFIFKFAEDHKSQLSQSFIRKAKTTADHL